eukprot:1146100-Pelagomonas_calceolata.AAC.4
MACELVWFGPHSQGRDNALKPPHAPVRAAVTAYHTLQWEVQRETRVLRATRSSITLACEAAQQQDNADQGTEDLLSLCRLLKPSMELGSQQQPRNEAGSGEFQRSAFIRARLSAQMLVWSAHFGACAEDKTRYAFSEQAVCIE